MTAFPNLDVGEQIASKLVRAESIVGDDEQDTILLRGMSDEARAYISSFPWCRTILSSYFGGGIGGSSQFSSSTFSQVVLLSILGYGLSWATSRRLTFQYPIANRQLKSFEPTSMG